MAGPGSFELPPKHTDEGAMARLFINEAAGPSNNPKDTVKAMGWMKRVIINRLKHPKAFDALGAKSIIDIIKAHQHAVQFAGFSDYPSIAVGMKNNIDAKIRIALDKSDKRQAIYVDFIQSAITAAKNPPPPDPCPTGLYFWKTGGSGSPGGRSIFFQSLDGNDFYTLPTGFFPSSSKQHKAGVIQHSTRR